jgi:acyl-CoA synthetase (AMP-forming)/AMP-acid ligase II
MIARFAEAFGAGHAAVYAWSADGPDIDALHAAFDRAVEDGAPVAILATSLALDVADERLGDRRYVLPPGSRVMQTGGSKAAGRAVDASELGARLAVRLGIEPSCVVSEYGMTELSSQLWEPTLRDPRGPRVFVAPGWVKTTVVDPETLAEVPPGEVGILRIDDAANLDSVAAIQTSDLARAVAGGVELCGRAPGAVPRGCSLAVAEALG